MMWEVAGMRWIRDKLSNNFIDRFLIRSLKSSSEQHLSGGAHWT